MKRFLTALLTTASLASGAVAEGAYVAYNYDGAYDDALVSVENEIISRGLRVAWTANAGEMLEETRGVVGSDVVLFDNAQIFLFCSAVISRKMLEADPMNIAFCPYGVFVADQGGEVTIGYRKQPEGVMQEIETLLDDIAKGALDGF